MTGGTPEGCWGQKVVASLSAFPTVSLIEETTILWFLSLGLSHLQRNHLSVVEAALCW